MVRMGVPSRFFGGQGKPVDLRLFLEQNHAFPRRQTGRIFPSAARCSHTISLLESPDVIESLVFSFLIYACLAPFFGGSPVSIEVTPAEGRTTYRPTVDPSFLTCAMGLAVLFALAAGASITHDFHMRILRWMRLTHRTARDNTWIDIFIDQRRYVEVTLTDGRRLFGWPLYYSNQPEEGLLYLYDPAWIDDDDDRYVSMCMVSFLPGRTASSLSCSRSSSSVRQPPGGSVSRPGRTEMRRKENSMGSKPAGSGAGAREPIEIEERGYNPPPVAKVERPTPSPPAPRPSPRAPASREHS